MWHSAKIKPRSVPSGSAGSCCGSSVRMKRDARGLEVAQEDDVVEVAHRVEVAEADALVVDVDDGHAWTVRRRAAGQARARPRPSHGIGVRSPTIRRSRSRIRSVRCMATGRRLPSPPR